MKKIQEDWEDNIICGGYDLPEKYIRKDIVPIPDDLKLENDLDRHIARLISLHPKLNLSFDILYNGSKNEKEKFLEDINQKLGIKSLTIKSFKDRLGGE